MQFAAFKHKSPNFNKLIKFGFSLKDDGYIYAMQILDGQFEMTVEVKLNGEVNSTVIDLATDEPYTLHLVEEASGAFVGQVRCEFEEVLNRIADSCFERDVFKGDIAHGVIEYVRNTYGDELEFLWEKFDDNAIWRRKDNNKWYAALLTVKKCKLGFESDEEVVIIDLRIDPETDGNIVDGKKYFAGYHMNKRTWMTIILDGSVPLDRICKLIDKSYILALGKKK